MTSLPLNVVHVGVVILHSKFKDSVIFRLLSQKQIKVRTSERLSEGTVIFPKAKLAFLMVEILTPVRSHLNSVETSCNNIEQRENSSGLTGIMARIDKFIGTHGRCTVVLQAPLFTVQEFKILSDLQSKYLHHSVNFLPAHSTEECVEAMLTMAAVHASPNSDILHDRMRDLMSSLLVPPPCLSTFKILARMLALTAESSYGQL